MRFTKTTPLLLIATTFSLAYAAALPPDDQRLPQPVTDNKDVAPFNFNTDGNGKFYYNGGGDDDNDDEEEEDDDDDDDQFEAPDCDDADDVLEGECANLFNSEGRPVPEGDGSVAQKGTPPRKERIKVRSSSLKPHRLRRRNPVKDDDHDHDDKDDHDHDHDDDAPAEKAREKEEDRLEDLQDAEEDKREKDVLEKLKKGPFQRRDEDDSPAERAREKEEDKKEDLRDAEEDRLEREREKQGKGHPHDDDDDDDTPEEKAREREEDRLEDLRDAEDR